MSFIELVIIGVGLAMDAFAVAVSKGLRMRRLDKAYTLILALFFGGFQALMPFIGWLVGSRFVSVVDKYDHIIAFAVLAFIGAKMIIEAVRRGDDEEEDGKGAVIDLREITLLALATSIDALAVGVGFGLMPEVHIGAAVAVIGVVTFLLSAAGVAIGRRFGARFKRKAEIAGGVILILIGLKLFLSGMGWINI